jgi:hypothetical protein
MGEQRLMPRVIWDDTGLRLYHAGVDRGMLYAPNFAVSWSGLVSVTESPSGGDATPYYVDGLKVLNVASGEDFAGIIEALSAPDEFAPCLGRLEISPALFALNQPRVPFGFSYRTLIGNDLAGTGYGYRIHLVYNALAQGTDYVNETAADTPKVRTYSWNFVTNPVDVPGYRPTAHVVFDTTKIDSTVIASLEDILYGNNASDPRMPAASELITLLGS